jgi:outer membrane protein assembly factor BamB
MRALITTLVLLLETAGTPTPTPMMAWHVDGEGRGRPAIDGGSVYFLSKRHEVLALDSSKGTLRWRQNTNEPGDSTEGSAVVVAGPVVVAGDYNLVAFDRITGEFRWRFIPAIGYAPGVYLGEVSRGLVYAGSPAGRIYAVSSTSGELAWSTAIANDGHTTVFQPATDGTDLVAGFTTRVAPNRGGVVVLDPITGKERWRAAFPAAPDPLLGTGSAGNPIFAGDLVIASSGDGTVYAFDRAKGFIRWTIPPIPRLPAILHGPFPLPDTPGPDYRPLARTWQTLFVGSLKGPVIAYDLITRREIWRYDDPQSGSVSFGLVSDDRSVYVPFASGFHIALDQFTGERRWQTPDVQAGFVWMARSVDGLVYLAGGRGGFVALYR